MSILTRTSLCVLLLAACGKKTDGDGKASAAQAEEEGDENADVDEMHDPSDPMPAAEAEVELTPPKAEAAAALLLRLAERFEASDETAVREILRMPEGLSEGQIREFLRELRVGKHLSVSGATWAMEQPFGTLSERFGEHAESVSAYSELELDEAWALGGPEGGAVFHWDGTTLSVAAVHELGPRAAQTP